MSRLLTPAFLLVLSVVLSSCTGGNPDAEQDQGAGTAIDFDDVKTPPAVSSAETDSGQADRSNMTSSGDPSTSGSAPGDAGIEIVPNTNAPEEPEEKRTTLAGTWEFLVCGFGADLVAMLIDVQFEGDTGTVTVKDDSEVVPGWGIESAEVTQQTAQMVIRTHDGEMVDFEGKLQDEGTVRGNLIVGEDGLALVRWLPSQSDSLSGSNPQKRSENAEIMEQYEPSGPDTVLQELRAKAQELGRSNLAHEMYRRINNQLFRTQRPEESAYAGFPEEFVAAASIWGERVVARAHLDIAYTMAVCGYSPEQAETHWNLAKEQLGEQATEAQQTQLETAQAFLSLHSDDESKQQSGREALEELRAKDPYGGDVSLGLAAYHEQAGRLEEALALHSELVALPTGAGDRDQVVRLWKELDRDPEAIEDHLNEVYKDRVHQFADEKSDAPRAAGTQRTVLGELFTGASCPPCVAADVATGGLEITYPKTDFIMLRYHEHIPAPDPLATADGQRRGMEYYGIQGTPSLYFNGQPVQTVMTMYGPITNAPAGYADLRQLVDPLLAESTEITIDLTAAAEGDAIRITAAVAGVDELPESWRLRLCLVEDEIVHAANNGVRLHEMVVRAMPGGVDGITPEDGKLAYDDSVSLQEVREQIQEYVSQIPSLPMPPLEMSHLHVVAFVQEEEGREVLQARAVPVSGLPAAPEADADAGTGS